MFAHAKIDLNKLLFAFYSFLRFNTSICQLDAEIDVSYHSLRRRVEQFARMLDAPAINLVGPVEIDEFYVSAGKKGRERDRESRSRALSKRGRGTCEEDKLTAYLRPLQLRRRILRKPGREALKQIIQKVL